MSASHLQPYSEAYQGYPELYNEAAQGLYSQAGDYNAEDIEEFYQVILLPNINHHPGGRGWL